MRREKKPIRIEFYADAEDAVVFDRIGKNTWGCEGEAFVADPYDQLVSQCWHVANSMGLNVPPNTPHKIFYA